MKARKLKSGKWNARAYIGKDSEGKSLFRLFWVFEIKNGLSATKNRLSRWP